MVDSLDDRFTTNFAAERFRITQETFRGTFEGIGADVTVRDGRVTILAPLPDSSTHRTGIMPADVILAADGEPVEGLATVFNQEEDRCPIWMEERPSTGLRKKPQTSA